MTKARQIRTLSLAALATVIPGTLCAQRDTAGRSEAEARGGQRSPALAVRRATGAMRLDGHLDETDWARADSIVDFRQREPIDGAAASERTVVKVIRDAEAIVIGVRAEDRDMNGLRAAQLRRDADLTADDNVTLLIDSFHDRRTGFVFRTNPNGAMWDGQIAGVDNTNANWNGLWDVAVTRDAGGWTAEFRIPLSTLRFRSGAGATFGFNVRRFISRKNEEVLWQSWGRTQGFLQQLNEGELTGLGVLERARNIELRPYALARAVATSRDSSGARIAEGFADGKLGLDVKSAISPTLTIDATVNTDFAQVEADRQIVNLTRFPLFFPEKREFFLESSGIFDFGTPSRAQLFYSRRIGLDTLGDPVPILGGARLYGRVGAWTLGAIDTRTGGADQANDALVRVKHDLLARSFIGAMAMQRSGPGVHGTERAGGIDVDLPLVVRGFNIEPSFWLAATQTPGVRGTPVAWRYGTDMPNDLFDNFVSLYRIESGYHPRLGFVRRTGIWETTGHINFQPRPGVLGIRRLDLTIPIPTWDIIADERGSVARPRDWQTANFEWRFLGGTFQSGDQFEANLQRFMDAPAEAFEIFRDVSIAPGRYWWTRGELQYSTSPRRPLSVSSQVSWGDFYDGRNTELRLNVAWRGGAHVILGADIDRNDARLAGGRFTAVQTSVRAEYAFDTRADLLLFLQYNNEENRFDIQSRVHWIPALGDELYIVWNSGYATGALARFRFPSRDALSRPLNGAIVIKLVHRLVK